jgi:hypothetical protein
MYSLSFKKANSSKSHTSTTKKNQRHEDQIVVVIIPFHYPTRSVVLGERFPPPRTLSSFEPPTALEKVAALPSAPEVGICSSRRTF